MALVATDIPAFASTQLELLNAELQAELESTNALLAHTSPTSLQRAGVAILNLLVTSQRTGLGGKTVLELELDPAIGNAGELADHGIRTGDIVSVQVQPKGNERKKELGEMMKMGSDGVVVRVGAQRVSVALDGEGDEGLPGGRLWMYVIAYAVENLGANLVRVKLANDVTYKRYIFINTMNKKSQGLTHTYRMNEAMTKLEKSNESDYTPFIRTLFGHSHPGPVHLDDPETGTSQPEYFDESLNDSQRDAIRFAIASREIALIHGPPGVSSLRRFL